MIMNLISIIVPVYNVQQYLDRCINSLLEQTYNNIEIILVDDGSSDESPNMCDAYSDRFSFVKVIHKQNQGLGYARNSGLKIASGEYIAFVDSDDYLGKEHLISLYNSIKENKTDVCYCGHTTVRNEIQVPHYNSLAGKVARNEAVKLEIIPRFCGKTGSLPDDLQMSACMALYKKEIIDKFGLKFVSEREFVSEDFIFNMDYLLHVNAVSFSDSVGYFYWYNETSLTHQYLQDRFERNKKMMLEMVERTKKAGIFDICKQRIYNTFITNTRILMQMEQNYSNKIGTKYCIQRFDYYVHDEYLQTSLSQINKQNIRFPARVINILIKQKKPRLLWILMLCRNKFDI